MILCYATPNKRTFLQLSFWSSLTGLWKSKIQVSTGALIFKYFSRKGSVNFQESPLYSSTLYSSMYQQTLLKFFNELYSVTHKNNIKVDCPQKQIDRPRPFRLPSWLLFVGLYLYSNLNKSLMEAIDT